MTLSNIILEVLKNVTEVIKGLKLKYCLFGGLAMQAYKRIRSTMDIDLILSVNDEKVQELISSLEKENFRFDSKKGIVKIGNFEFLRFIYADKGSGIDVFVDIVTAKTEYQKEIIRRRQRLKIFDIEFYIATCEDLVLLKILASRPVDKADAQSLIEENMKELDRNYLFKWAQRLGIFRQMQYMLKERDG